MGNRCAIVDEENVEARPWLLYTILNAVASPPAGRGREKTSALGDQRVRQQWRPSDQSLNVFPKPGGQGGDRLRIPARRTRPFIHFCPPIVSRGSRVATEEVNMQVGHSIADNERIDMVSAADCLERLGGQANDDTDVGGLRSSQAGQAGHMALGFDEEMAEIVVLFVTPEG
jgi:hypothetical protein